ncbi:hydroxyacid dehydrogenase [Patescibacteria group bacterium]|nr:hydroxyacid dehydrogenase [Patescibacteria group bacterium]MDE1946376.1 hydroxyacid dehydrogenase [Patescibacteria group bacterium]MDE2010828.1 hydroxyacid dehydrogenase [Patescibacteria group bacterium]MDE2233112.1 hydroxyacid dehydrogenase [Patescibacteria group bacterium]
MNDKKHKIAFFETADDEREQLRASIDKAAEFAGATVSFTAEKLNAKTVELAKDADIVCVFINSNINKDIIDKLPSLKLIATRSTGFDHIDCAYAAAKGIKVANMPAYGSRTVAEYTFALILGMSRKVLAASHQIKNGQGFDISNFRGFDLRGKTIGIVGTGRIGLNVAQIAKGFDMSILAYDVTKNDEQAVKIGFSYCPLEELLGKSDIITLHVPYNDKTKHLINKDNVRKVKPGALLVNTARGEVCDTEAILTGIQEKILKGVALDVLEGERSLKEESQFFVEQNTIALDATQIKTLLEDHMLINMPEVFITPHIAFFTEEAQREIVTTAVANIAAFLRTREVEPR